jgi:peptidoglycan hydrolase-like protein with peptidoglycan-binding domain
MNRSMKSGRRLAATVAATVALAGAVAAAFPGSASASTPQCTTYGHWNAGYITLYMPTTSSGGPTCYLATGDNSGAVRSLQEALNSCYGKSLATDGIYGSLTRSAVIAIQKKYGLTQDGVYGPNTRERMGFPDHAGHCWDEFGLPV